MSRALACCFFEGENRHQQPPAGPCNAGAAAVASHVPTVRLARAGRSSEQEKRFLFSFFFVVCLAALEIHRLKRNSCKLLHCREAYPHEMQIALLSSFSAGLSRNQNKPDVWCWKQVWKVAEVMRRSSQPRDERHGLCYARARFSRLSCSVLSSPEDPHEIRCCSLTSRAGFEDIVHACIPGGHRPTLCSALSCHTFVIPTSNISFCRMGKPQRRPTGLRAGEMRMYV